MPLHLLDNLANLTDPTSSRNALALGTGDSPQFASITTSGATISGSLNATDNVDFNGGVTFQTNFSNFIDLTAPTITSNATTINLNATDIALNATNAITVGAPINSSITLNGSLTASGIVTSPDFSVTGTSGELVASTDIRTWALGTNTFGPVAESQPQGLTFKPDGTMMFITGQIEDKVWGYTLTTPWNTTTATNQVSVLVSSAPCAMYFTSNGLQMFVLDTTLDRVDRYSLTTAWNLSSATLDAGQTKVLTTISGMPAGASFDPRGLEFNPDGKTLFVCDDFNNRIYEISLQTAWNLTSTMALVRSYLIATTIDNGIRNISFNNTGTRLFVAGTSNIRIYEFKLATPYSLASVTYVGRTNLAALDNNIGGMYYNDDAQKCFYTGSSSDTVREFIATPQPLLKGTRPLILADQTDVNDRVIINSVQITDTTASSNTGTGALLVAGGVGVGGNISVNGTVNLLQDQKITWSGGTSPYAVGWSGRVAFGTGVTEWARITANRIRCSEFSIGAGLDTGTASITSTISSIIKLGDGAGTNFNRLQFGGIDGNFPAIKRNGNTLDIVLASDAGFTDLKAKQITATGPIIFPSLPYMTVITYTGAGYTGAMVYVYDEIGGACMAYFDGADWRRVDNNTTIAPLP